jgi:hypothetical protein
MNRRHYLLTVALSLAAVLAGHALYGSLAARASAEPRRDSRWEYCAVVKAQGLPTPRLGGSSYAKAIAKLGEDGWEMVGEGPLDIRPDPRPGASANAPTALFFKRRKD